MARRRSITVNPQACAIRVRGRERVVGLAAAVGAFSVFGMTPLATAPSARADDFGVGEMVADFFGAGGAGDVSDAAPLQQFIIDPLHSAIEDWIHSDFGAQVDGFINTLSGQFLIGDGDDGTADHPEGFAGGLWFGDGGDGWDATGADTAGGDGGDASGLFGRGGDGGDGAGGDPDGLPALGGAGGDGGVFGSHGVVGDPGTLPGVPSDDAASSIGVTGTWLTDEDGRVVIPHGLNQVYKVPPYEPSADGFSDDDAKFLADNGFNTVRVGVIWAGVEPEPGVFNDDYLASIEQTVQTLADHGIASELDMHQDLYSSEFGGEGAPEWAVQAGDGLLNPDFGFPYNYFLNPAENHAWDAFWSNAEAPDGVGLENHYAQMWEHVANYFSDDPDVVGYEIINEPWAGSQWLPSLLGSSAFGAQELTPFYNQVDAAIRAVDPATPVLFEPNTLFGSLPVPTHLGTVDDPNTVFAFHNYCIATTLIPSVSSTCDLNADVVMDNAAAYADAHGIPALMTEFGATDNTQTITDGMQAADEHRYGWLEWAYTGNDITSSSPNGQALVFDPSKPPVGDNVDTDKLAALAAPYPQAIAGTPDSWSFDDGTFQLSYSTERADGLGSFGAGAETVISVPAIEYPDGYQVSVDGGHVVSGSGASDLVVASNGGAETVTVTVRGPAAG